MAGMNVVAYLIMAGMKVLTRGGSKEEQGRMGGAFGRHEPGGQGLALLAVNSKRISQFLLFVRQRSLSTSLLQVCLAKPHKPQLDPTVLIKVK